MGSKYISVKVDDRDTALIHKRESIQFDTTSVKKQTFICTIPQASEFDLDLLVGTGEALDGKTPLLAMVVNYDDTNYVKLGKATGDYFCKAWPEQTSGQKGPPSFIWLDAALTNLYLIADTADCIVEVVVWYED